MISISELEIKARAFYRDGFGRSFGRRCSNFSRERPN